MVTLTIVVENKDGENQKLTVKSDPPITEATLKTGDTEIITANRILGYIHEGVSKEYSSEEIGPIEK